MACNKKHYINKVMSFDQLYIQENGKCLGHLNVKVEVVNPLPTGSVPAGQLQIYIISYCS